MAENDTKKVIYGILEFLQEEFNKPNTSVDSKESIEVAMQCLETAFGVNVNNAQYKPPGSIRNCLNAPDQPTASARASAPTTQSSPQSDHNLMGEPYRFPPEATPDQKASGDEYKNLGNEKMKDGNFIEARAAYDKAIELDGRNAVYFCNRAAAYLKLNDTPGALRDCQIAVQLQPSYARAYGRMGVVYSTMRAHREAVRCYKKASELDPTNESYQNNLKHAEEYVITGNLGSEAPGGGGPAGMPNLQQFFSDPNLINMASQMLQNPMMMNLMRNFASGFRAPGGGFEAMMNPGAGGAPGEGAGAGAGAPGGGGMENFLQMGQAIAQQIRAANPNLAEQLQSLNGMGGLGGNGSGENPPPRSSPPGDSYDL